MSSVLDMRILCVGSEHRECCGIDAEPQDEDAVFVAVGPTLPALQLQLHVVGGDYRLC